MSDKDPDNLIEAKKENDKRVERFADLLDSIESTEDKKKHLWREIYENAITDRENASLLFTDAYSKMQSGIAEHMSLGPIMAKYLELIGKAEERAARIDPDDLFDKIQG